MLACIRDVFSIRTGLSTRFIVNCLFDSTGFKLFLTVYFILARLEGAWFISNSRFTSLSLKFGTEELLLLPLAAEKID